MRVSFVIGSRKFYFGSHRMVEVDGVNSLTPGGKHFLMWDFDNLPLDKVKESLSLIQLYYDLPEIKILNTGRELSYHAYCFQAMSFRDAWHIILDTPGVCTVFLLMAHKRGYFTLRYSPKAGRAITYVDSLPSLKLANVDPLSIESFVRYSTKAVHE